MALEPRRFRAPAADGALLAEPPLGETGAVLASEPRRLDAWNHDFQGRRAGRLRAMARRQAFEASKAFHDRHGLDPVADLGGPLIVTGHQPELFHPGVWVKNFAAAGLARDHGGVGLNLIVDDDVPKDAAIRVPFDSEGTLRAVLVPFDEWGGEAPFEDWKVGDDEVFASFADRVVETLGGLVRDPLIREFWPRVLARRSRSDRDGYLLAAARHEQEVAWGVANAEVPLGTVCESEAFLWFASHLLAHLPRFQQVHNAALGRYRKLYGIRSRHHPVPALGAEGQWREAPFWVWRAERPRRRPLLVRQLATTMELRIAGEAEPFAELPLAPEREACCAVERLRELPARRIRLRTRALTTTMFARLLLGDAFIHGIGGAKYDELGDEIVRGFFGLEPPAYLTVSMSLWLGLPEAPVTEGRLRDVERALRDMEFNPDRHLDPARSLDSEQHNALEAKRAAIAGPQETRRQRVARWRAIRASNEILRTAVAGAAGALRDERERLRAGLRRNALARSREYAAVLHPADRLLAAFGRAVPSAFSGAVGREKT